MFGESWNVFTKRVLVEKHFSGIMYENPRGPRHPLPPSADDHLSYHSKQHLIKTNYLYLLVNYEKILT